MKTKFEKVVKEAKAGKGLHLYYVTTGKCSKTIKDEAQDRASRANSKVECTIVDAANILTILKDYLEGVAPAIPKMDLPIAAESPIQNEGQLHRFDPRTGIESWVFTMMAADVGKIFERAGVRLFARNIRGFLGSNVGVNDAMRKTILEPDEADNFWYYNNGLTVVCDDARLETHGGMSSFRVEKPQVINGLQTTQTLYEASPSKGSVLVKVIKIPRHAGDDKDYDRLVKAIVKATNWQNYIKPSDFVSNDSLQVSLERSLRKLRYLYIRKRMKKSEARTQYGGNWVAQIDKTELAQAVGACQLDPYFVRKGKEGLFEDPYYKSIFSSKSTEFYLSRYWLMKRVQLASRGKPNRAYANWLVLHTAWTMVAKYIEKGKGYSNFRDSNERYRQNEVLTPLDQLLDDLFKAALAFFANERGKGELARDISTFFFQQNLHTRFSRFWSSSKNKFIAKVEKSLQRFKKQLDAYEVPE